MGYLQPKGLVRITYSFEALVAGRSMFQEANVAFRVEINTEAEGAGRHRCILGCLWRGFTLEHGMESHRWLPVVHAIVRDAIARAQIEDRAFIEVDKL